jgi:hypothetical protein
MDPSESEIPLFDKADYYEQWKQETSIAQE